MPRTPRPPTWPGRTSRPRAPRSPAVSPRAAARRARARWSHRVRGWYGARWRPRRRRPLAGGSRRPAALVGSRGGRPPRAGGRGGAHRTRRCPLPARPRRSRDHHRASPARRATRRGRRARALGREIEAGGHGETTFLDQDLIVLSPGVPMTLAPLACGRQRARARGRLPRRRRWSRSPAPTAGTTTTLIGLIGEAAGTPHLRGRQPRHAAHHRRRGGSEPGARGGGGVELSARGDPRLPAAGLDHPQRHRGPPRPLRELRRVRARQGAHPREPGRRRYRDPEPRRSGRASAAECRARVVFTSLRGRPPGPAAWVEGDRFFIDFGEGDREVYDASELKLEGVPDPRTRSRRSRRRASWASTVSSRCAPWRAPRVPAPHGEGRRARRRALGERLQGHQRRGGGASLEGYAGGVILLAGGGWTRAAATSRSSPRPAVA